MNKLVTKSIYMVQIKSISFFVAATVSLLSFGAYATEITMESCIVMKEQVEQAGRLEAYCPDTFKGASITIHTLQRDTGCFLMTLGSTYMNDERGITSNRKSQAAKASEMDAFKKLKKGEYCKTREDAYTKLRESADHQMTEFNAQKSKVATPATAEVK